MRDQLAGRTYAETYRVAGRDDLHDYLLRAVVRAGGRVIYSSDSDRAPMYLGVEAPGGERMGLLIYPFRITRNVTKNRPADEVRGQIRYGSEESWKREHPLGRDIAGVDLTLLLCIDVEDDLILGLDPQVYDPLPMGISVFAKQAQVDAANVSGWEVWEKVTRPGRRRREPRSPSHFETLALFKPERLFDWVRFERDAADLRLEPALRLIAAKDVGGGGPSSSSPRHHLEEQFALSSEQILDIIHARNRLAVAVRGGVAEYHLEQLLRANQKLLEVERLDVDAMHDFDVTRADGTVLRVECKNVSPNRTREGDFKVEVQKTRISKGDPASRLYRADAFDVVAACLFSATGKWSFRFHRTDDLPRHREYADRLAAIQHVTEAWCPSIDVV